MNLTMRMIPRFFALAALQLGCCSHLLAATAPQAPTPLLRQLDVLGGLGGRLSVPSSWQVREERGGFDFAMPGNAGQITYVEVKADNADEALRAAWGHLHGGANATNVKLTKLPDANGWRDRVDAHYESKQDHEVASAIAGRSGDFWGVLISTGTEAAFDRYQSGVAIIHNSLTAPGFQRESLAGRTPHRLDAGRIATMRQFMGDAMRKLQIPGGAIALLDRGEVVFETGMGIRAEGRPEKVDSHTVFMNASTTKAMTTMMMAGLVDRHILEWDMPAVAAYPEFKLADTATTQRVLMRNLVCACTGLPRRDIELLFGFRDVSARELINRIADQAPTSEFGENYQYNNQLAAAAGYIAGHAAYPKLEIGAAYDQAMRDYLFKPLGMRDTTFDMRRAQQGNHASPHGIGPEGKTEIAEMALNYAAVPIRPAGGAWTSIHDLALFWQLEARAGRLPSGKQLISAENALARRVPQVVTGLDTMYGMGLGINRKLGVTTINHSGSFFGFNSTLFLVPDSGIGLVAMTNSEQGMGLLNILSRRLLELTYDAMPQAESTLEKLVSQVDGDVQAALQQLGVVDHSLDSELGSKYANPKLGTLVVTEHGGFKVFNFSGWKTRVVGHKGEDGVTSFSAIDPTEDFVEFRSVMEAGGRAIVIEIGQERFQFSEVAN